MGLGSPWENAYIEPQQKEKSPLVFMNLEPQKRGKYSLVFINKKTQQKEQNSVMFINKFPKINQKMSNLRYCLESNQCIDGYRFNKKTGTIAITLQKPMGGENLYVRFGYIPLTTCNHT